MSGNSVYALLADGSTVLIQPAGPSDHEPVRAMHEALSPGSAYLRFFSSSAVAAEQEASRVCREPGPGHAALLALCGDEVVGCTSYERIDQQDTAEVAFAVADRMHHKGIATLLLEHLAARARDDGIAAFMAETLPENTAMLRVFTDAGLPVQRHYTAGVVEVTVPLPRDDTDTALESYLCAVDKREGTADTASLRHLLAPRSIAVVGAGQRRGGAGRAILDNIRAGGYPGQLYAVHPHARHLGGVPCVASAGELPEAVDLAVIAVPPAQVAAVAETCGTRGVQAVAVVTAGLDDCERADLLAICRRHGMRLAGPGCQGIAVPGAGLDATLAACHLRPGTAGLITQSGRVGLALASRLSRLGVGISSFASVGRKLDVSGNDLLLWWENDGTTRLAILYTESFGNPRKFARTARRVAATMPVLTVPGNHSPALFEQAGLIPAGGPEELIEAAAFLAAQPVPAGRTVAIVSNGDGAAALAAAACSGLGLTVHQPRGTTRRRLRSLVPAGGTITGPVNMTSAVSSGAFQQALELLAADEGVDAVIALVVPTAGAEDLTAAVQRADVPVPLAAVVPDQAESVRLLDDGGRRIPAYDVPEAAVRALARAAAYGEWRAQPAGGLPAFPDVAAGPARALVRRFLAGCPDGGWLPGVAAAELLRSYGMTVRLPVSGGTGVRAGIAVDDVFGQLVFLEAGGADRTVRAVPLTTADADRLVAAEEAEPRLRDLLLRVSRLADDLPEVAELSLAPVLAPADGLLVADARIRVRPVESTDPFLRHLG